MGYMVIYTKEPVNEAFILKAIKTKLSENYRVRKLQDYYNGKHDIMQRFYTDPTKPNNRIPVNYCKDIADFLTAYVVGVPVKYNAPQIVQEILLYNDEAETMQELTLNMNVTGFGAELFYIDEDSIPRYSSIDPTECIFVFDDKLRGNITNFIRIFPQDDELQGYYVTLYNNTKQIDYILRLSTNQLTLTSESVHYWNDVPCILYPNSKELQGSYEQLIPLQNALNKVVSDEVNDFESMVDAYLVLEGMQGTQPNDIKEMKQNRVLLTDKDSKAYWLTKTVNTDHIRALKEDLIQYIRELGKLPNVNDISGLGVSGEAIRMKLIKTEIQATKQERTLIKGIQRKMELLYTILSLTTESIGKFTEVIPTFTRNFLIQSEKATIQDFLNGQSVGVVNGWELRQKLTNETDENARKNLPSIVDLIN